MPGGTKELGSRSDLPLITPVGSEIIPVLRSNGLPGAVTVTGVRGDLPGRIADLESIASNGYRATLASVRAASTTSGNIASSYENGDVMDGVTLATGNRILLKDRSDPQTNGIYVVNASGAPTRAADADSGAELALASVYVEEGTLFANTSWAVQQATITLGTTPITWALINKVPSNIALAATDVLDIQDYYQRTFNWYFNFTTAGDLVALEIDREFGALATFDPTRNEYWFAGLSGGGEEGSGGLASTSGFSDAMPYIAAGDDLWAFGASAGDRLLDNALGRAWLSTPTPMSMGGSALAAFTEGGVKQLARVSYRTGMVYRTGCAEVDTGDGQSNMEGQQGTGAAVVLDNYPWDGHFWMPDSVAGDIWLGDTTSGGGSNLLPTDVVTGLIHAQSKVAASLRHGTTPIEGMGYSYMQAAESDCAWVPDLTIVNLAEGGQSAANLLENPVDTTKYNFENFKRVLAGIKAQNDKRGLRTVYATSLVLQTESNSSETGLAAAHELLRQQRQAAGQAITGQTEKLNMFDVQMSSFYGDTGTSGAGCRSMVPLHIDTLANNGNYFLLGPTYPYPYTPDLLHHTPSAHFKIGQLAGQAKRRARKGQWDVLRIVGAVKTTSTTLTLTWSEAKARDTNLVELIANDGLDIPGLVITSVTHPTATTTVITTSTSNAGATSVRVASKGHLTDRAAATIPRSNLRSSASYGEYFDGSSMYKWAVHQEFAL